MTKQSLTKLSFFIFTLGALFYCYEFFIQVSPAVMTKNLMQDLNANATQLGLISGCFYYSYTALQMPAGLLLDRFGARLILTVVTFICAVGALLFGLSHSILFASFARLLIGAGSAFAFVSALYITIRWIPHRYLGLFVGLVQTLGSIGAIFGTTPLASLVNHTGWRHVMFLFFVVGAVLAIITWLFVRNHPAHYTSHENTPKPSLSKTLKTVLKNRQTWFISLYSFAIWAPITAFAALWGVPFLKLSDHLNTLTAATGISLIWIGVAIGSPLIGWISDKIHRRCIPLFVAAIIGCISMTIVIYAADIPFLLLGGLLFLIGLAASGQSLVFAVIKDINHTNVSGAANGFNNMIIVITGALFQPFIGKLLDLSWTGTLENGIRIYHLQNYHYALSILPVCFILSILMSLFFIRETYCRPIY